MTVVAGIPVALTLLTCGSTNLLLSASEAARLRSQLMPVFGGACTAQPMRASDDLNGLVISNQVAADGTMSPELLRARESLKNGLGTKSSSSSSSTTQNGLGDFFATIESMLGLDSSTGVDDSDTTSGSDATDSRANNILSRLSSLLKNPLGPRAGDKGQQTTTATTSTTTIKAVTPSPTDAPTTPPPPTTQLPAVQTMDSDEQQSVISNASPTMPTHHLLHILSTILISAHFVVALQW